MLDADSMIQLEVEAKAIPKRPPWTRLNLRRAASAVRRSDFGKASERF